MDKNKLSFQMNVEDFLPADESEKQSLVVMRESVGFWKDGMRRLKKNKIAMVSLIVVLVIFVLSFVIPTVYPYKYEQQIKTSVNLAPMQYSETELAQIEAGEKVFPHILGTDNLGRDYAVRVMMGSRVSLLVGLVASAIIMQIGTLYGTNSGINGDVLIIILLAAVLNYPLKDLSQKPGFEWIGVIGVNLISIFLVFALLYWVGMARIVRSQIMILKEQEYVTAARALGASSGRIIRKHLLTNCIGTLIVTTTLQIPSSIFTESFLSFLGLGVNAPMPSLGRLASAAINGLQSYPHRLFAPAIMISVIILSFNLLGDGLRDAFDPKMKN